MPELNLVLLGPPGSGKGTQGERLHEDLRLPYYATGDILRGAVKDETDLGRTAKEYMDRGDLVPDEVIVGVIAARIDSTEARDGFILDGFPRTTPQAEALDAKLAELGRAVTAVLATGHVFHVEFNPPRQDGVCDLDDSELVVRDDDKPDVIRKRLDTYHSKTEPLISYYDQRSVLRRVAGESPPDEVAEEIRRTLATMRLERDEAV
jgi:adenylate kinase